MIKRNRESEETGNDNEPKEERSKLSSDSLNLLIPYMDVVVACSIGLEHQDYYDMINTDEETMKPDIRKAYTGLLTSLSWRYLKQFKDENGRWIPEKENEREDVHTALAMQVTAAFRDMGVTGTLTHEVKTDLRKSLEKKCSNEKAKRIRLEKREANKKRNKAERDMVEITQQPPDDDEEEEEDD